MIAKSNTQEILEGKIFAVLSYLSIFCIVPLVFKKENDFALSHAKQGLVIFIGEVAIFVAHIVLGPGILRLGFFILGVLSLWGIVEALKGRYINLPVVAKIAKKITL